MYHEDTGVTMRFKASIVSSLRDRTTDAEHEIDIDTLAISG
jgi:hypothetical protein